MRTRCFLYSEVSQRAGEVQKIKHKPSVIFHQPQELPHLLFDLWSQAGCNCCCLTNLGSMIAVHDPRGSPTLVQPLSALSEQHADAPYDAASHYYDNIIQIGSGVCSMQPENLVNETLKSGQCSEQPERKCDKLVQSKRCCEGCFFFFFLWI